MFPPPSDLTYGLRLIGSLPALLLYSVGLVGIFWGLYLWSKTPQARAAERCGGWAAVLLGAALLLRLGDSLLSPPGGIQLWHWGVALVVLPWLVRLERLGAIAAMGTVLSLAAVLAGVSSWLVPVDLSGGLLLAAGSLMLVLAIVLDRWYRSRLPPPAPPPAVDEQALQQRLDSAEANEAADKYTRE